VINLSADVDAKFGVIPSGANQSSSTEQGSEVTVLAPPKSMFQPVKYPALHIFVRTSVAGLYMKKLTFVFLRLTFGDEVDNEDGEGQYYSYDYIHYY